MQASLSAPVADRMGELETRECRPGDERVLLGLIDGSLRGGDGTYGGPLWRWKHLDNPFGRSCGRYLWDGTRGRAAALRIMLRWKFRLPGGSEIPAARAVDTATHPEYRRGGLFGRLTAAAVSDLAAEGCGFIFNTPNARVLPGYLQLGWAVVAKWPVHLRVLRPLSCLGAALGGSVASQAPDGDWGAWFGPAVMPWREFSSGYGVHVDELVQAWERERNGVGLRTPRSWSFLAWRYGGHPTVSYGFVPLERGSRLEGLAILRPNRRFGLREAALAEVFLRPGSPGAGQRLMTRVIEGVLADYCAAVCSPGTREHGLLRGARFFRVPGRGITLTARPLNPVPVDPASPGSWDLTLGDLEVF
jgi:GNAT superfamily N-acetyltransferase